MPAATQPPRFSLAREGDMLATLAYPAGEYETAYVIRITGGLMIVESIEVTRIASGRCTDFWSRPWPERPPVPQHVLTDAEALLAAECCCRGC